jgi:DNA topoisomerase-1
LGKEKSLFQVSLFDSGTPAIVATAAGHLFTFERIGKGAAYPDFTFDWRLNAKNRQAKIHAGAITSLAQQHAFTEIVVATDYDIEGSVIGYNILRFCCNSRSAQNVLAKGRRMKFSTLTQADIRDAWISREGTIDWPRVEAGLARHAIDGYFGINLSRALTSALSKGGGGFHPLSMGRVQGPTLQEVARREQVIEAHVPKPNWIVRANAMIGGMNVIVESDPRTFLERSMADMIKQDCEGKEGVVASVDVKERRARAPPPFNLPTLQREASSVLKLKPARTLHIAEKLYLDALISYPRTESEIIPPTVDVRGILESLQANQDYATPASAILGLAQLRPSKGSKTDEAHPPILPTGAKQRVLPKEESRLLDLITRRFLACFGEDERWSESEHKIVIAGHEFELSARTSIDPGWTAYYPFHARHNNQAAATFKAGDPVGIENVIVDEEWTKPPARYVEVSLLKYMETSGIGTKSTRADIIEKIKERGYVDQDPLHMTALGKSVVSALASYVPDILSADMTRQLEEDMDGILHGSTTEQDVEQKAMAILVDTLTRFKAAEPAIGAELAKAYTTATKPAVVLGPCPACNAGQLVLIVYPGKKRYVECTGRASGSCAVRLPIIQTGRILPAGKACPSCAYPMVKRIAGKKKVWEFCVNWANCPGTKPKRT